MNKPFEKKIPLRQCAVTNERLPKQEMYRIVRTPEGNVVVDDTGKLKGHGVYLSKKKEVILDAKKRHCLDRKLETNIPDSIYDELLMRVSNE